MPIASQASTRRTRDSTCAQPICSPHITQEAERCASQHRACPRDVEMTKCSGGLPPPVLFGGACSASEHRARTNTSGRPLHRRCQRSCQWSRSPPPNFVRRPRRAFLSDFCAKREKIGCTTRTRSDTEAKKRALEVDSRTPAWTQGQPHRAHHNEHHDSMRGRRAPARASIFVKASRRNLYRQLGVPTSTEVRCILTTLV